MNNASGSTVVYAIMLFWPENNTLVLGAPTATATTKVTWLGYNDGEQMKTSHNINGGIRILIPYLPFNKMPCQWAWVFKLENLATSGRRVNDLRFRPNDRRLNDLNRNIP